MDVEPKRKRQTSSALRQPFDYVFRTNSHVRILRVLYKKGSPMSNTLIARWAGLPVRTVRAAVSELENVSVIEMHGSQHHPTFSLKSDSVLADAVVQIFGAEETRYADILETIEHEVSVLGKHLDAAWLFGSVARGDDKPDSDIDIAVVSSANMTKQQQMDLQTLLAQRLFVVTYKHQYEVSVVLIDEADIREYERLENAWWENLKAEARTLVGDDPVTMSKRIARQAPNRGARQ
ncbi:nucleotidyltransferase family protein [Limimonas halophila]|nr:nucleotidyltransferase domain-containing protein [Limimonas halophila]